MLTLKSAKTLAIKVPSTLSIPVLSGTIPRVHDMTLFEVIINPFFTISAAVFPVPIMTPLYDIFRVSALKLTLQQVKDNKILQLHTKKNW
jgi:hypothetical protein